MEAFGTIVNKVAVMLVMIVLGYVITRRGILTEKGAGEITSLLLKIVTPCLIVNSLLSSEGDLTAGEMLLALGLAILSLGIGIAVSYLFFRQEPPDRKKVLRFSLIFSNAGFMGIPLVQGIVGARGVVYGSLFVVAFNLVCWTYGYAMMTGGKLNLRSAILNPGILGLAIGLPLYFFRVPLPPVVMEPITFLADLNTPLAMLVIGSHVARVDLRSALMDLSVYKLSFLRLLAVPLLYLGALLLLRPEPDLLLSSVIQASAPVAANCVLFAVAYGGNAPLASKTVAVSTVLSILTIPLMTVLAQGACTWLFG